jgi:hypothetical protein
MSRVAAFLCMTVLTLAACGDGADGHDPQAESPSVFPGEDSDATGIDGDETSDAAPQAGAAYLFQRCGAAWSQTAYLKASNTDAGDGFGDALAFGDGALVVSASNESSGTTTVNGDQTDNSVNGAGAAYVSE